MNISKFSGEKLLIIHADDFGMCHSVNVATIEAIRDGVISSLSMMIPCPWILEAVQLLKEEDRLRFDHGIHLTMTSEWKVYKWGPTLPRDTVSSLTDGLGYFWSNVRDFYLHARVDEFKKEAWSQVERAKAYGLYPSHLDTHMGTAYMTGDFLRAYIEVAYAHGIMPMLVKPTEENMRLAREMGLRIGDVYKSIVENVSTPMLDRLILGLKGRTLDERLRSFKKIASGLRKGTLSMLIVHLGLDKEELRAIIGEDYWERVLDYMVVMSREAKEIIERYNVRLVGWRDLLGWG